MKASELRLIVNTWHRHTDAGEAVIALLEFVEKYDECRKYGNWHAAQMNTDAARDNLREVLSDE